MALALALTATTASAPAGAATASSGEPSPSGTASSSTDPDASGQATSEGDPTGLGSSGSDAPTEPAGSADAPATADAPAPTVGRPAARAVPGSYRERTETWLRTVVFPAVLGRPGDAAGHQSFGQRVVQSSPEHVARTIAATPESRRRQVTTAYRIAFDRNGGASELDYYAGLNQTSWSHDRIVAHLFASGESRARFPLPGPWIDWVYQRVLGYTPDAGSRNYWIGRLASGTTRGAAARQIQGGQDSRTRQVRLAHQAVLGRAPTGAEMTYGRTVLGNLGGDPQRFTAEVTVARAPTGYRIGVVGDSIGWDMTWRIRRGESLPALLTGGGSRPSGAGRLGCAVLSDINGWRWPSDPELITSPVGQPWGQPGDGRCWEEVPRLESNMLATRPQVLVWPIGAWEWTRVMRPNGDVIAPRSNGMRDALAAAIVRRVDAWVAAGSVEQVLFPEWACVGNRSAAQFRDPAHTDFIRAVLDQVVTARPTTTAIAATPAEVCVGGDPKGQATAAHRVARGDQFHWIDGHTGAAWGWKVWFAPAIADLPIS